MKAFFYLLLGLGILALGAHMLKTKNLSLDSLLQISPQNPSSPRSAESTERPNQQTVKVDRQALVGAWLSEDGREILMLRDDGKSRRSMAYKLRGTEPDNDFRSATITGVVMGDWRIAKDTLELENEEITSFTVNNPKLDLSGTQVASSRKFEFNARMKTAVEDMMRDEFKSLAGMENPSQPVIEQSESRLVITRKGVALPFRKIAIEQARDPNGEKTEEIDSRTFLTLDISLGESRTRP